MCLWLLASQLTAFYWELSYAAREFVNPWSYVPLTAMWQSVTGVQSWFNFLILAGIYSTLVNILMVGFYLFMESYAALSNQTFYEGMRGIKKYTHDNWRSNVHDVYGSYMWIRWLVPFYSPPPSDGYTWNVSRHHR